MTEAKGRNIYSLWSKPRLVLWAICHKPLHLLPGVSRRPTDSTLHRDTYPALHTLDQGPANIHTLFLRCWIRYRRFLQWITSSHLLHLVSYYHWIEHEIYNICIPNLGCSVVSISLLGAWNINIKMSWLYSNIQLFNLYYSFQLCGFWNTYFQFLVFNNVSFFN